MDNNKTSGEVINLEEIFQELENSLNEIIKNSTYPQLTKYIDMLPKEYASEENLFSWGFSYLNEYYKIIGKLDGVNSPEVEDLKYKIYILYLYENYNQTVFDFEEFITFSRLINTAFTNYNPNRTRKRDNEPYQSDDEETDYILNEIANIVLHSPHPHAYEITTYRFKILLKVLNTKRRTLFKEELDKIDLDDPLLSVNFSESRIKELKQKKK